MKQDDYETTAPDPKRFGTGWEFKIPEFGEAFFATDYPLRLMGRDWWKPKDSPYGGKRWSKKLWMNTHTVHFNSTTDRIETCKTCGNAKVYKDRI